MGYHHNRSGLLRTALLTLAGGLLAATDIACQNVDGTVVDRTTGTPLAGADVLLRNLGSGGILETTSDEEGRFSFSTRDLGQYRVEADHPGYVPAYTVLTLQAAGEDTSVEIFMSPDPILLDPVEVGVDRRARLEASLALYGVRLAELGRRVIDDDAVTQFVGVRDVGDVLERHMLPGVDVIRDPQNGELCVVLQRARSGSGVNRCALIVLDGSVLGGSGASLVSPSMVRAVVVLLPGEATLVFGTRGGSGAVLMFSR